MDSCMATAHNGVAAAVVLEQCGQPCWPWLIPVACTPPREQEGHHCATRVRLQQQSDMPILPGRGTRAVAACVTVARATGCKR